MPVTDDSVETIDKSFYHAAKASLERVNSGDQTEVPPYMSADEWKTHNALIVDQVDNPGMQWCVPCQEFHVVDIHD